MGAETVIGLIIIILILGLIVTNIRIVPQTTEFVIERLGKYHTTWDAGLHVKVPLIDKVVRQITSKEQVLDTPPQPVITKDNVTMQIDAIVYFHVFDAKLYAYGAVNPVQALSNLSATSLRNIVGELTLDETLTSRDTINSKLTLILDEATDRWGIKVSRVEVKNIMPPEEIRRAMEQEMKAERDRRQTVLEAEGHRQAVITRAEGDKQAMILEAEGQRDAMIAQAEGEAKRVLLAKQAEADGLKALKDAGVTAEVLELKRYESLIRIADGRASKIIIPTDAVNVTKNNVLFSETTGLGSVTEAAPEEVKVQEEDPCCDEFENPDNAPGAYPTV